MNDHYSAYVVEPDRVMLMGETGMVRQAALTIALLLASCGPSPAEKAAREYEMITANNLGNALHPGDKCQAARRAKEAFLQEGDSEEYDKWAITEYNACAAAERGQ